MICIGIEFYFFLCVIIGWGGSEGEERKGLIVCFLIFKYGDNFVFVFFFFRLIIKVLF